MSNLLNNTTKLQNVLETLANKATPSGGIDTSDATATASDILSGKTAYVDGEKITGNITTKTSSDLTTNGATVTVPSGYYASQASKSVPNGTVATPATTVTKNPTISVNSSGLITASVSGTQSVTPTVTAGYVSSGTAGTITVSGSATKQLTTKGTTTITPTTSNQTAVASGVYTTGTITVKGDSNLVASNIVKGKSIFGVSGSAETGADTSDATATADEIFQGEIAYVNGDKVTGTFTIDNEVNTQTNLISQIEAALEGKAAGGGNLAGGGGEVYNISITNSTSETIKYVVTYLDETNSIFSNTSLFPDDYGYIYINDGETVSFLASNASFLFCDIICDTSTLNYNITGDYEIVSQLPTLDTHRCVFTLKFNSDITIEIIPGMLGGM